MAVNVAARMTLGVTESFSTSDTGSPAVASSSVVHTGFDQVFNLTSGSSVPVTDCAIYEVAMTAGAATIDLTSLTGTNGATKNANGKKPQIVFLKNKVVSPAQDPITVTAGASNGHDLMGASWSVVLQTGQAVMFFGNELVEDVGSSAKTWDIAGDSTDVLQVGVIYG